MPIITTHADDQLVDDAIPARRPRQRPTTTLRSVALLPWATFGHIATAADEARFVDELERRSNGVTTEHRRSDVTALLNALRGGLGVESLLAQAPGLRPERLLGAYRALGAALRSAADACETILEHPAPATLAEFGDRAALLLPTPIGHLRRIAHHAPQRLRDETTCVGLAVERAAATVRHLERRLDTDGLTAEERAAIAGRLFDQHGDCALAHDDFLPARVGALVPTRVASLLGEHRQADAELGGP